MRPEELQLQNKLKRLRGAAQREANKKSREMLLKRIKKVEKQLQGISGKAKTTMEKTPKKEKSMEETKPKKTMTKKKRGKNKKGEVI